MHESIKLLVSVNIEAVLLYSLFIKKDITKKNLEDTLKEFNFMDYDKYYKLYREYGYIEEVYYTKESRMNSYTYIKSTDKVKNMLLTSKTYKDMKRILEIINNNNKEINNINQIQDGIDISIRLHNNMEHFNCIYCLYNVCINENINVSNVLNQVNANVMKNPKVFRYKNYKKIQPDLSILYNNKTIFIEVERGNTTKEDMYDKLTKYQLMDRDTQSKMDIVIFAAPNQKDLDATKKKVLEWEQRFDYDYEVGNVNVIRDLQFIFINISKLNKKNTLRKILYNYFRQNKNQN